MNVSPLPSHHAILFVSPRRDVLYASLKDSFPEPYHKHLTQTVIDIDTARVITSWAKSGMESDQTGERAFIVSFHTITHPAQNALLKILEEPQAGVRFIFITTNKEKLLDTVLSRMHVVEEKEEKTDTIDARIFLETSPTSRMKLPSIISLLERVDEEGRKDREAVRGFIFSLLDVVQGTSYPSRYLQEILQVASYAGDPSASGKALLEYLALLLPVLKA